MNNFEEMRHLITLLNDASRAYYQENREIITDREYDGLYNKLEALEAETGTALSGSPTRRVGYEAVDNLVKVHHAAPMLSLDKTKEPAKLVSFLNEQKGLLSWKLDGLTVVLRYENGTLAQAVTRGNGLTGEDVTHNAKVFANIPLKTSYDGSFTVRGEAVISFADFEKINERIPDAAARYKNPRNLCSGTVRQLDSKAVSERSVRFYAFGLVAVSGDISFDTRSAQMEWLDAQGFDVVEYRTVDASNVESAVEDFKKRVGEQPVASDGLVLIYDGIAYGESLGATSKFPRYAIAFKWADEICETVLRAVEWNTSRTGLINPVALFDTVDLEGTEVSRASLHNVSILRGLELGIGDTVTVYKANMIIPQVADNLTRSNTAEIPAACPVCGGETEISGEGGEAEVLYCVNPNCKAQRVMELVHFVSRDAMNIEGLSEQTIEKFTERGWVNDFTDLFRLERYGDEIMQTEGFGKKSFENLLAAVEKAKDAALPNFINALGIRHVGLANAKLLCAYAAHDMERIIEMSGGEDYEERLSEIKGFGEAISRSLHLYFKEETNVELVRKALAFLRIVKPEESNDAPKPLAGLIFVITGETHLFENRKALQSFIEAHGGKATGSVTGKTSYLINNDSTSTTGKNKKAAELGVPVITEEEFMQKFEEKEPLIETV